jgi:uncharacterized protein involved in outer membrane biogenesis
MNFKKIAKITGISLVSLLALLIVLPFAFKGKIVSAVKEAANNNLNARVSFNDDISLSLLSNFPNLSLGIQDVKVVGVDSFAQDTRLVLDLASVWKGETVLIRKIAINDARAQVIFLKSGAANFDLAKPDTTAGTQPQDTGAAPVAIKINDLSIENTRLHYIDHSLDFEITTNGLNWHANGDFADENDPAESSKNRCQHRYQHGLEENALWICRQRIQNQCVTTSSQGMGGNA